MGIVNRSVAVVRPLQPFLLWASSIGEPELAENAYAESRNDPQVYLLPEFDSEEESAEVLEQCWPVIFETELDNWSNEERHWPEERTLEMFLQWFEIELCSTADDLCVDPVIDLESVEEEVLAERAGGDSTEES